MTSSPSFQPSKEPTPSPRLQPSVDTINTDDKERQRSSERRSRLRRVEKRHKMVTYVASLERTVLALQVASDVDSIWDEFLDDDTKLVRTQLRRSISLAHEVKQMNREKEQLQQLVVERELVRREVVRWMRLMETVDKWEANCTMWKALARIHFRPLPTGECIQQITHAMSDMAEYAARQDKQSSGLVFMGWRESRQLVPKESALQFNLHKTYRGHDLAHHIDMMWRVFSEPELYSRVILGGHARVSMDILQKLSPNAWVVRNSEIYDGADGTVHELYLLFRETSADGAIVYSRAIQDSDLHRAISTPTDLWTSNYYWMHWELLDPSNSPDWTSTDYRISVGGCLRGGGGEYLHRWLFELVVAIVRCEEVGTRRPLLNFS